MGNFDDQGRFTFSLDLHLVQIYIQFRFTFSLDLRLVQIYVKFRFTFSLDLHLVYLVLHENGNFAEVHTRAE